MKWLLIYSTTLLVHAFNAEETNKNPRYIAEGITGDYSYAKIPVYYIQNPIPEHESKVPVAIIPGVHTASVNAGPKEPKKFGFYAPYKTQTVTPIHEPQRDTYASSSEAPVQYPSDDYKFEYTQNVEAGKDYQPGSSFFKYDSVPKPTINHQSILDSNTYAALTPALSYDDSKKLYPSTYDASPAYYIKYVPYPVYTPESAYPSKPLYKSPVKESASVYTSTEDYSAYSKYASTYPDESNYPQYATYKYIQQVPYKYEKFAKKYTPTSYVTATIGKTSAVQYGTTIHHEPYPSHGSTKLAPVPLPVEKYVQSDEYKEPKYQDAYPYAVPSQNVRYRTILVPQPAHNYEYQNHYAKKQVDSVSSTESYESNTKKTN